MTPDLAQTLALIVAQPLILGHRLVLALTHRERLL